MAQVVSGVRKAVEGLLIPQLSGLKTEVAGLHREMDLRLDTMTHRFNAIDQRFDTLDKNADQHFQMLRVLLENAQLRGQLEVQKDVEGLKHRVSKIEAEKSERAS